MDYRKDMMKKWKVFKNFFKFFGVNIILVIRYSVNVVLDCVFKGLGR